jgi:hypothetical protein
MWPLTSTLASSLYFISLPTFKFAFVRKSRKSSISASENRSPCWLKWCRIWLTAISCCSLFWLRYSSAYISYYSGSGSGCLRATKERKSENYNTPLRCGSASLIMSDSSVSVGNMYKLRISNGSSVTFIDPSPSLSSKEKAYLYSAISYSVSCLLIQKWL